MTKCVNCRYRAVIDGEDDHGRICANGRDVYLRSDVRGLPVASWDGFERGFTGKEVKGFEILPRDPETYKDWQVGDIVRRTRLETLEVIFRSGELVVLKSEEGPASSNYTCDELFKSDYRLVLTDIERQIIEERKAAENIQKSPVPEFRKGEPVLVRDTDIDIWVIAAYYDRTKDGVRAESGRTPMNWKQCIPYNEKTMHLLGTTEDYKEEQL